MDFDRLFKEVPYKKEKVELLFVLTKMEASEKETEFMEIFEKLKAFGTGVGVGVGVDVLEVGVGVGVGVGSSDAS